MNVREFTEVLQELYPAAKVVVDEVGYGRIDWGKPVEEDVDKNNEWRQHLLPVFRGIS